MSTTYVNMGQSKEKTDAIIVYAFEPGQVLMSGIFYGFIKGANVKLFPADYVTKCNYKGKTLDITIHDLKERR